MIVAHQQDDVRGGGGGVTAKNPKKRKDSDRKFHGVIWRLLIDMMASSALFKLPLRPPLFEKPT
jgi:hypothetical protein